MDDRTIDRVFAGLLDNIPPVNSKIVRIFTSSTFTDTALERNTLMAEVYPRIKEYCREKHGLEFQVVDMRWGVRDEATDDHMTSELCMKEIDNCQRLSMGPNFVVLLGQKYGYRPIPTYIPEQEFQQLMKTLKTLGVNTSVLETWYKLDTNSDPPVLILQPISSILVHFNDKDNPQLQAEAQGVWWETLDKMQKLLRKAASILHSNGKFDFDTTHNYCMSVTEREVIRGILNVKNTKSRCLAYVRYITNINLQNLKRASLFVDIVNRAIDGEAVRLLASLRDERLPNHIETTNIQRYTVEWIGRDGINPETHDEYLQQFISHFYKSMLKLVDRAMKKEDFSTQGQIVTEILQHLHACMNSVKIFHGRDEDLGKIKNYLLGPSDKLLVLSSQGGCGKTSLLAKAASLCAEWFQGVNFLLLIRFLGTTPDSSSSTPMLISLCQQISYNFMLPYEEIPDDLISLAAHFKQLLNNATGDQPLLLFLDSVNQLTDSQDTNSMSWIPMQLPPHVKIVVSSVLEPDRPEVSKETLILMKLIDDPHSFMNVAPLGENLAMEIINKWMRNGHRKLTNFQRRVVMNSFAECSSPIFVKLVFAEICRWKSYSKPQDTFLAHNVTDTIMMLFERIEKQHGRVLVSHALAYITASKSGLSETELEDLLSLDDIVLDDVYQYHMPPVRRIPPLLWTRIRNDLPNYLSEREAGGVSVLNWYHRQFKETAIERYFQDKTQVIYFHSSISDYFLGTWGGGIPKPFRYTEIQRHRFNLDKREDTADRKVPLQPLVFHSKTRKISRYNLRKFGELAFHLIRADRIRDLYDQVLFNYSWLHSKISSCPMQAVLSDFEDAYSNIRNEAVISRQELRKNRRETILVADAIRLGGMVISQYPDMLAAQLTGRLLPEIHSNDNVRKLLKQCDEETSEHCALVPAYHCMHTPGGPLKHSLEGHQFAVFGFRLTSDFRYIVSVSNKFITWDLASSDLSREVNPGIDGIMQGLELSPDNRYAVTHTSSNQVVFLNMLTSEYAVLPNPFGAEQDVGGCQLTNTHLVVYGSRSWAIYSRKLELLLVDGLKTAQDRILELRFACPDSFIVLTWKGCDVQIDVWRAEKDSISLDLSLYGAMAITDDKRRIYANTEERSCLVTVFEKKDSTWTPVKVLSAFSCVPLQLRLCNEGRHLIGTFVRGFRVWALRNDAEDATVQLPHGVRNIAVRPMCSNVAVVDKNEEYVIAGVRKNLFVWNLKSAELLITLDAHFARIIDMIPLTTGNWNLVITSSIDKTVKVWNINDIFEEVHVIDRLEMRIDSIRSTASNLAVTATRNCIGIWDVNEGKLQAKLAENSLGAIITNMEVTMDGRYVIATETGHILIWDLSSLSVVFKVEQPEVKQIITIGNDRFASVSKLGFVEESNCHVTVRSVPEGELRYELRHPIRFFRNAVVTNDLQYVVVPGFEKLRDTLMVHAASDGLLLHKIPVRYPDFKEFHTIVAMSHKKSQIALIDQDKGNIIDVKAKKFVRSVKRWNGKCTAYDRYGLHAPARGGLEIIELKHGKTVRVLIPKITEGVFSNITMFTSTGEYVLYYHSGRNTIRLFRASDSKLIANYRVQAELSAVECSPDGKSILVGTVDGCLTVLVIVDRAKPESLQYLSGLPSRTIKRLANVPLSLKATAKSLFLLYKKKTKPLCEKSG